MYVSRIPNIEYIKNTVREDMNNNISEGSIFIYPSPKLEGLTSIINDTHEVFDNHFAVNKCQSVYVARKYQFKLGRRNIVKVLDQNPVSQQIKSSCPSIKNVYIAYGIVGKKSLFYDTSTHLQLLNKYMVFTDPTMVKAYLDTFKPLLETFGEDTHPHRYIILDCGANHPCDHLYTNIAQITPQSFKTYFSFLNYILYMLHTEPDYVLNTFKNVKFLFVSTKGIFKFDVGQVEADILAKRIKSKDDIINLILIKLRRLVGIFDHTDEMAGVMQKDRDVVDSEWEIVRAKEKEMNKTMNHLLENTPDETAPPLIEQYVKSVAQNPDDMKASVGAGIINDIKAEMVKNQNVVTSPKEKKMLDNLNKVNIDEKSKANVIEDFRNMQVETSTYSVNGIDPTIRENKFINFNRAYDKHIKNYHIKKIAKHFSKNQVPLYLSKNITVKDISDEFNYLDKYTFTFKDKDGVQSTISLKMPKYIDGKFLYIGGNRYVLYNQLLAFPIVKIGEDVIITTSRNKATLTHKNGKYISPNQYRLSKTITDIDKKELANTFTFGNYYDKNYASSKATIEYCYLSEQILSIKTENIDFTFKVDESIDKYGDHSEEGFLTLGTYKGQEIKLNIENDTVYGYDEIEGMSIAEMLLKLSETESKEIHRMFKKIFEDDMSINMSDMIVGMSKDEVPELYDKLKDIKNVPTNMIQTHIKVMDRWIPLIYMLMYTNGLFTVLEKGKIEYSFVYQIDPKHPDKHNTKPRIDKHKQFMVETADAWIVFNMNKIEDTALLFPLSKMDLKSYKTAELEKKSFLALILEEYTGSINIPIYLDNFKENLIDPITEDVLSDFNIPSDFLSVMLYANNLLATGKSSTDIDLSQKRIRGAESITSIMYEVMASEYESYAAKKKRGNRKDTFTINENAVLNKLHELSSLKAYSSLNPIQELTEVNTAMFKGHRGMNLDRAYTAEKRMFDESFYGILGLSSTAGAGVGINKQMVIDANITSPKGYLSITKGEDIKDLKSKHLLTVSEALHPLSFNHDDPQRVAMNLSQAQQILPVRDSDPMLVSYGYDEMIASMTTDFAISPREDGMVGMLDDHSIVLMYNDGTKEVRMLNSIEKNSAKSFYTVNNLKLKKGVRVGYKFRKNEPIAYNPKFFKEFSGDIMLTPGPMLWVAVMSAPELYEDSIMMSESASGRCAKSVVNAYSIQLKNASKINSYKKQGDAVYSADVLLSMNKSVDEDFLNKFFEEGSSEMLAINKKVKRAGRVVGINIYYTGDLATMSKSLRDLIADIDSHHDERERNIQLYGNDFDKKVKSNKSKKVAIGSKINGNILKENETLVEYYVESSERMSIGDKGTVYSALKGIVAKVQKDTDMPMMLTSNRRCDLMVRKDSIGARKVYSPYIAMAMNKALLRVGDIMKETFKDY